MTIAATQRPLSSWELTAPERILVATDLTDIDYLLGNAIAQSQFGGASLILLHVIPPVESVSLEDSVSIITEAAKAKADKAFRHAEEVLGEASAQARAAGVDCEIMIQSGHPSQVVTEVASRLQAGRLILGTHGRRNIKKFFLRSAAHEILKSTQVPVWTIGPHARPFQPGRPGRILHPVSLSPGYQESARLALTLAKFYQAHVTLLHVVPRDVQDSSASARLAEWTTAELGRLIPENEAWGSTAMIMVEAGEIVPEILRAAEMLQPDLIVMGSNPDTAFWPIYTNNTVYNVIAEAECPVLTLQHAQAG